MTWIYLVPITTTMQSRNQATLSSICQHEPPLDPAIHLFLQTCFRSSQPFLVGDMPFQTAFVAALLHLCPLTSCLSELVKSHLFTGIVSLISCLFFLSRCFTLFLLSSFLVSVYLYRCLCFYSPLLHYLLDLPHCSFSRSPLPVSHNILFFPSRPTNFCLLFCCGHYCHCMFLRILL